MQQYVKYMPRCHVYVEDKLQTDFLFRIIFLWPSEFFVVVLITVVTIFICTAILSRGAFFFFCIIVVLFTHSPWVNFMIDSINLLCTINSYSWNIFVLSEMSVLALDINFIVARNIILSTKGLYFSRIAVSSAPHAACSLVGYVPLSFLIHAVAWIFMFLTHNPLKNIHACTCTNSL